MSSFDCFALDTRAVAVIAFPSFNVFQRLWDLQTHCRGWRPLHAGHARGSLVLARADARFWTTIISGFVIMCARRHYARAPARPPRCIASQKRPPPCMRSEVHVHVSGGEPVEKSSASPFLASSLQKITLWCPTHRQFLAGSIQSHNHHPCSAASPTVRGMALAQT